MSTKNPKKRKTLLENVVQASNDAKEREEALQREFQASQVASAAKIEALRKGLAEKGTRNQQALVELRKKYADEIKGLNERIAEFDRIAKGEQKRKDEAAKETAKLRKDLGEAVLGNNGFPPDFPEELNKLYQQDLDAKTTDFYLNVAYYLQLLDEMKESSVDPETTVTKLLQMLPAKEKDFLRQTCEKNPFQVGPQSSFASEENEPFEEDSEDVAMGDVSKSEKKHLSEVSTSQPTQNGYESPNYCLRKVQALGAAALAKAEKKQLIKQDINQKLKDKILELILST